MKESTTALLLSIACVAAIGVGAVGTTEASAVGDPRPAVSQTDGPQSYSVIQGDQCIELRTIGNGSRTVEEFYDYRTPETHEYPDYVYSSYGTQELQRDDTTTMFVYQGSEGDSLVLLHDRLEGETEGGTVTMQFDDLPEDGEWAVIDDSYDGHDDRFTIDERSSRMTWVFAEGRNDGGAFRGLGDDTEITITPAFNDSADFRQYSGEITDWQVVSAADGGYERTSLDSLSEEVTVVAGGCAELSVSSLTTLPSNPSNGETVDVQATVYNDGNMADTFTVEITADDETLETREVELDGGEHRDVSVETTFDEGGTHKVSVANVTANVEVSASDADGDGQPGFGISAALAALLCAVAIGLRSRR